VRTYINTVLHQKISKFDACVVKKCGDSVSVQVELLNLAEIILSQIQNKHLVVGYDSLSVNGHSQFQINYLM